MQTWKMLVLCAVIVAFGGTPQPIAQNTELEALKKKIVDVEIQLAFRSIEIGVIFERLHILEAMTKKLDADMYAIKPFPPK